MYMKKFFLYIILLLLLLFIPSKTADVLISNITNKDRNNKEWVIESPEDTSKIEEVKQEENISNTKNSTNKWWQYPEEILEATRSGDDLLVLVNKKYKLPSTYAPKDLVKASTSGIRRGESYYLRQILISDLKDMNNDAKSSGIDLSIVSAYRSYDTQVNTYNYWLKQNNNNVDLVDTFSARPGHSQHQLGTVIDFSTNEIGDKLGDEFNNTKASDWLKQNAYKYGFVISYPSGYENITGYKFESWHYRYIGRHNAQEMISKGLILETYLKGHDL